MTILINNSFEVFCLIIKCVKTFWLIEMPLKNPKISWCFMPVLLKLLRKTVDNPDNECYASPWIYNYKVCCILFFTLLNILISSTDGYKVMLKASLLFLHLMDLNLILLLIFIIFFNHLFYLLLEICLRK